MISKIRESRFVKGLALYLAFSIVTQFAVPSVSFALTGGPKQPEFNAFTPIGTSDMVDLSSGDFSYNIPIMDVGGYPISLGYKSGITMDQEASWVGLGWDLSVGQISREVRGMPDDFNGDKIEYETSRKKNITVGADFKLSPAFFGVNPPVHLSFGAGVMYNSYTGVSITRSGGVAINLQGGTSLGIDASSGPDGLVLSPSVSFSIKNEGMKKNNSQLGLNAGVSFNSRQGLTNFNMSASYQETRQTKDDSKGNKRTSTSSKSTGSSISLVNNTYTPQKRNAMSNGSFTFNGSFGVEVFGVETDLAITGYGSYQELKKEEADKFESAYGYQYTDNASSNDILDFNREKDGSFSVNTTNLPLTNYTYDIYSVQGQGVSGMFRPYRSQVGYVYDNFVEDDGNGYNLGLEVGATEAVHIGVDIKVSPSYSYTSGWFNSNNAFPYFSEQTTNHLPDYEKVYFKNVGDLSTDKEFDLFQTNLHNYSPMRIGYDADHKFNRSARNEYVVKTNTPQGNDVESFSSNFIRKYRLNRNQGIQLLTKADAQNYGFNTIINASAKVNHTAEIRVTRNDGARYIYGKALYNTTKREATFSVDGSSANNATGLVTYPSGANSAGNSYEDKYFERVTTPAYAHTYLLTDILSTDYSDMSGDGPTPDDLGSYTHFEYVDKGNYKWRVPFFANKANYNEGLKTDKTDGQGSYVYGEKDISYIQEITTKTHKAIFYISPRDDGYGVTGEDGGIGTCQMYELDSIALYALPEYENYGAAAIPIKVAHFEYDYSLCPNIDNNVTPGEGKLTLKHVYFTYRDSRMGEYTDYNFHYDGLNPSYNLKGYDIWANYKPNNATGVGNANDPISPSEFNYVEQNQTNQDSYAAAWSLTSIDLPSGGKIEVTYESDDYQYVQNLKAMEMFKVAGLGTDSDPTANINTDIDGALYSGTDDYNYIYVKLDGVMSSTDFKNKCLTPLVGDPVYFRFLTNMTHPGGKNSTNWTKDQFDYITGYFFIDNDNIDNVTVIDDGGGNYYASIPVKLVDMEGGIAGSAQVNPISKAGWQFARTYLSRIAYNQNGSNQTEDFVGIVEQIMGGNIIEQLLEIFQGPNGALRAKQVARRFIKDKSWVRLMHPDGKKLGGGVRVKKIEMLDNWDIMTGNSSNNLYSQSYGQEYTYQLEDGTSSGVATYEPVGCKENPFVQPVFSETNRLLAPDEKNYIEKPFGESFFPSPQVTYSRVEVKNLERVNGSEIVKKHATGKVVTEFYTSKDYPTLTDQIPLKVDEDKTGVLGSLLNLNVRKYITLSQGYLIHTNDMNGKQKSQRVYAEGIDDFISGVDYNYDLAPTNSGSTSPSQILSNNVGKLNNEVTVINPDGTVESRVIGVEYDVVNDFRENYSETKVTGVDFNLAGMLFGFIPIFAPVPIPSYSKVSDRMRMATTTKVINTFGILRETVAYDAGAAVKTRNLAWDANTGEVLLTQTVNEYDDEYYTFKYPAYWYYNGMGQASQNSDLSWGIGSSGSGHFSFVPNSVLGTSVDASQYLNNGDEVWLSTLAEKAWVDGLPEHTSSASNEFDLMLEDGTYLSPSSDNLKVIRSGRRNLQPTSMGSLTLMKNPIDLDGDGTTNDITNTTFEESTWDDYRIVNAGVVEFSDNWLKQCECGMESIGDTYNPYKYDEKGVWRALKSWTYLTGRSSDAVDPTPRRDGFFVQYSPFYYPQSGVWNINSTDWTFVSKVTKYSPFGFELENEDALNRYSAAEYGYNNIFPMAVGANTQYREMGYDGFEDYSFDGCDHPHFSFKEIIGGGVTRDNTNAHTGSYSLKVGSGSRASIIKPMECTR